MSITDYKDQEELEKFRDSIVVVMERAKVNEKEKETIWCDYDKLAYRILLRDRWDIYEDMPIKETSKLGYLIRRVVNSDLSRVKCLNDIVQRHKRVIIFYNYDYELDLIKGSLKPYEIKEWNGHQHDPVPETDMWIYLVQYNAGAEGWNCITSNCIIFYSLNYSYKTMAQAEGRIDRMNTKHKVLYYYYLRSHAPIDNAIMRALRAKRDFNERTYFKL